MTDLLFELGLEELPVGDILPLKNQLIEGFDRLFTEQHIDGAPPEAFATNRRIMLYFPTLSAKARDISEEVVGPSARIAYQADGSPAIPLLKFLESQGGTLEEVRTRETAKGPYVVLERVRSGENTADILQREVPQLLKRLAHSKGMLWNSSNVPFSRPISNILILLEGQLIPCSFAGVSSSNMIRGHRLLSASRLPVNSFREYIEALNRHFVVVDEQERRQKIVRDIQSMEGEWQCRALLDPEVLERYVYYHEYPVVFSASFDPVFLEIPREIIQTFMIREKGLNPMLREDGSLINQFVGVSNFPDKNGHVARGNERVIGATFQDARFFWDQDRADDFADLRQLLAQVTFHQEIGSYLEKTTRMAAQMPRVLQLCGREDLAEPLSEAALSCKNDLVTRMVREFPSLQGIMGGLYLKEQGASPTVSEAVYHQYDPKGYTDQELSSFPGAILSLVDRMDSLAAFAAHQIRSTGSKDPFGIRRDINGIIKLLQDFRVDVDFRRLLAPAAADFPGDAETTVAAVSEQLRNRLEGILRERFPFQVVQAVLDHPSLNIPRIFARAQATQSIMDSSLGSEVAALHRRIRNIIRNQERHRVSENHLREPQEKILFELLREAKPGIDTLLTQQDYPQACERLMEIKPVVDEFFEAILVMDQDPAIRSNRLGLLQILDDLLSEIADFSRIAEQGVQE